VRKSGRARLPYFRRPFARRICVPEDLTNKTYARAEPFVLLLGDEASWDLGSAGGKAQNSAGLALL
jgi:hypothetical protein